MGETERDNKVRKHVWSPDCRVASAGGRFARGSFDFASDFVKRRLIRNVFIECLQIFENAPLGLTPVCQ